jgi:hypothetical protein
MKKIALLLLAGMVTALSYGQGLKLKKCEPLTTRPVEQALVDGSSAQSSPGLLNAPVLPGNRAFTKIPMSSSLNVNGVFSYDQRYVTVDRTSGLFTFGNRAGGVFGNTGNDLKFKFTPDKGDTWDSVVIEATGGRNFRYPSLIVYNPAGSTNPGDLFGIVSGPIYENSWTNQFFGSVRLDGQHLDINYQPNEAGTFLNHMNTDLYCSPDGHITVVSQRLNGNSTTYTYHGWEILNGTFNPGTHKVDWQVPFLKLHPALKEEGRIDATRVEWSPDGSIGYLTGTAVDSNETYNPYGVEWPVIYKTTDHGVTWTKLPPFDFSTIPIFSQYVWPTVADTTRVIPRWYNKWASPDNQQTNGATVDIHGNLHIFGVIRGTMSLDPDSLNYFYTLEPIQMFDVYMKPGGGWDAMYIDTLVADNPPDPGTYGISWDHQLQMSRTPDGSRVFCLWTDTDPTIAPENTAPDIKGMGYNAITGMATEVKNFTSQTLYWFENWWMRVGYESWYNEVTQTTTLPVTTSIPGLISEDPLLHQFFLGLEIEESDYTLLVGQKEQESGGNAVTVKACYPNPFSHETSIDLRLDKPVNVTVDLFNLSGTRVMTLEKGVLPAGLNHIKIPGETLHSGFYTWAIRAGDVRLTGKIVRSE